MWLGSLGYKCPIIHTNPVFSLEACLDPSYHSWNTVIWTRCCSSKNSTKFNFPLALWDIRRSVDADYSKPRFIYFDFQYYGFGVKTWHVYIETCNDMKTDVIPYEDHQPTISIDTIHTKSFHIKMTVAKGSIYFLSLLWGVLLLLCQIFQTLANF